MTMVATFVKDRIWNHHHLQAILQVKINKITKFRAWQYYESRIIIPILSVAIEYLCPDDLQRVLNGVWEARVQWYNLGLGLNITPDSLDAIELANSQKPDRCFRAMLTQWLREHHRPTWSGLAKALKSPSVGYTHLAEQILETNVP